MMCEAHDDACSMQLKPRLASTLLPSTTSAVMCFTGLGITEATHWNPEELEGLVPTLSI
jgi:hypothetical protein